MRQIARFWLLVVSFGVGFLAFAYLFVSFFSFVAPDAGFAATGTEQRLLVTGVALVSMAIFVWAFNFVGTPEPESLPAEDDEEPTEPTLGNRNR